MSPLTIAMIFAIEKWGLDAPATRDRVRLWRSAGSPDVVDPNGQAETLGSFLRQARTAVGLTQRTAGGHVGCGQMQVSRWENDAVIPDAGELATLFDLYHLDADARARGLALARSLHDSRIRRSA